ncbi:K+-sensing histidine kinase KdpD [Catenuloplanes nepalensis]|uniref:histidine kinase n=1 Tax=Catenuloplanes nepalensis TaxID=587533 RepID=A0ABT9N313_9ACTN|nr:HAMP domain-containing sensor histidine kinase [Catenuloplanes nepalensis]MDP9798084.1 K+-sensing histidine kinase KdpD [Catenuloplanes nepalensis]
MKTAPEPESRDAFKAQFLAVVSHELRTPLTSIAAFTEMLSGVDLPEGERPTALSVVQRNTERMLVLVEDLMLLSRLESGDLPVQSEPVALAPVVAGAGQEVERVVPTAAVRGTVEAGPPVRGDASLLHQLFYAVTGAMTERALDGSGEIQGACFGDHWTITVRSTQAETLTDEYFLATSLPVPGDGRTRSLALWMLLARAIAHRHGGAVSISFAPETGAAITVRLPAAA